MIIVVACKNEEDPYFLLKQLTLPVDEVRTGVLLCRLVTTFSIKFCKILFYFLKDRPKWF